jgi:tellurite resistance protein TehA-like permease
MTTTCLLSIVAPVITAATGAVVADVLSPVHALYTIFTSYILWGTSFFLGIFILATYFRRLTLHGLPPSEIIILTGFLPLGPLGQGGNSKIYIGG